MRSRGKVPLNLRGTTTITSPAPRPFTNITITATISSNATFCPPTAHLTFWPAPPVYYHWTVAASRGSHDNSKKVTPETSVRNENEIAPL
ncbi:hypothetical protein E2C01_068757 [Portunus trituberculatus]|uniref:Uncharacterized protein n=1 Tax=Portunus trituberculatus TaxID=210409 RepID=A0A5B7HXB1_PORTR|nr:hypothetical protein [Portunus trituberculatus]